ncbi:TonB-dependent receptor plug domain-containing protein [Treponema primitia]|uniref:TonB-dependent receptor n=1 Tax=Treponema primitia TaxID=88058 RepID=UPI00397E95B0
MKKAFCSLCAFLMVLSVQVFGQDNSPPIPGQSTAVQSDDDEIVLPVAEVKAKKETAEHISQEQMIERGDTNLFEAMRWIPGIVENGGHAATDTGGLSLRGIGGGGHGTDFMTIMQDGVPISDLGGYGTNGRIDYAGILTGGLESIDVAKGYSSVLLGPNIMAGVLMVRTAKPQRKFELSARTGFDFDAGGFSANTDTVTVGTRLGMFYARAGIQEKYVDHWRLSDDYEPLNSRDPSDGGDPQQKGNRIFTNANTFGANIMAGVNPLDELDIWTSYAYSSRKILPDGWAPPRAGNPTTSTSYGVPAGVTDTYILMGAYPYRDRHDATLHAEWTQEKFNLGLHGYFNLYTQRQYSLTPPSDRTNYYGSTRTVWPQYLNNQYTIGDLNTYTFGVNLDGGYEINDRNKIQASVQFRQNDYDQYSGSAFGIRAEPEHTDKYQTKSFTDNLWFAGAEYTANPFDPFTVILGFGLDMMDPQKMDRWGISSQEQKRTPQKSDIAGFNAIPQWTAGLFYDLTEQHELHLTYAKKNRFASFSDKEGAEGTDTPNPTGGNDLKPNMDLLPRQVHHFEFGYKGYFLDHIRITSAIYTNYELNKIATVTLVGDPDGYERQNQNIDENLYYGFEFGTEMFLNDYFTLGGSFAINQYKILHAETSPNAASYEFMGSSPLLTTNGYFSISPFAGKNLGPVENIRIMPRFEYVGTRFVGGDTNLVTAAGRTYLDDYVLLHLGISVDIARHYSASISFHNIMDQLYYTTQWMPAAGRSFNISFGAKF